MCQDDGYAWRERGRQIAAYCAPEPLWRNLTFFGHGVEGSVDMRWQLTSCFEVDSSPKSGIQLNLELRHILADGSQLILQFRDLLLHPRARSTEHLLCLLEWHVKEGIANLVAAPGISAYAWGTSGGNVKRGQSLRDKLVFVCELELGGDIVEFLLFLLQVGVSKRGQDIKGVDENRSVELTFFTPSSSSI